MSKVTAYYAQLLDRCLLEADELFFPPFLTRERASTPLNATPYVAKLSDLREGRILKSRTVLVQAFLSVVEELRQAGVEPRCALVGGSAIGPKPDPSDLDTVIFYVSNGPVEVDWLKRLQGQAKQRRIDARLIPMDMDEVMLLKIVSYFSMLYSKSEGDRTILRGLLLIDLRGD